MLSHFFTQSCAKHELPSTQFVIFFPDYSTVCVCNADTMAGSIVKFEISDENCRLLLIPAGFLIVGFACACVHSQD